MDKYIKALIHAAAHELEISASTAKREFQIESHEFYNVLPEIAAALGYGSSTGNDRFVLVIP